MKVMESTLSQATDSCAVQATHAGPDSDQQRLHQAMRESFTQTMGIGLVCVNSELHVVSLNPQACTFLDAGEGLAIRQRRLHAWARRDGDAILQAVRQALDPDMRATRWIGVRRLAKFVPILVCVAPMSAPLALSTSGQGPYAMVSLHDPLLQRATGMDHLQAYGFTPAEQRLAEAMTEGEPIDAYAQRSLISKHTVKSHLDQLFAKTGTRRQQDLVRFLVLTQPPVTLIR